MKPRKKIVAYGCWNNDRHIKITENDDAGMIHNALFKTKQAAIDFYKTGAYRSLPGDPIVKVTVEIIGATSD